MEYLALNNGIQMPLAGFGTFMLNKETCTNAVTATIETGYRMTDTAEQTVMQSLSNLQTPLCQVHDKKIWRFFSTSKSQLRTAIPNWLYQYTLSCYVRSFFIFSTISTLLSG